MVYTPSTQGNNEEAVYPQHSVCHILLLLYRYIDPIYILMFCVTAGVTLCTLGIDVIKVTN